MKYHSERGHSIEHIMRGTVILCQAELVTSWLPGFCLLMSLTINSDSSPTWLLRSQLRPPDKHSLNNAFCEMVSTETVFHLVFWDFWKVNIFFLAFISYLKLSWHMVAQFPSTLSTKKKPPFFLKLSC